MLNKLKLVIPPIENWKEGFLSVSDYLSSYLSFPVELFVVENDSVVIESIKSEEGSLGVFTTTAHAQARQMDFEFTYLVTAQTLIRGKKQTFSFGHLITHQDMATPEVTTLENPIFAFKDKNIGFVEGSSCSGNLYPRAFLKSKRIIPEIFFNSIKYFESDEQLIDSIANKTVDLGATRDMELEVAYSQYGDIFYNVAQYGPMTNPIIVAHHDLESDLVNKIVTALLSTPADVLNQTNFACVGFSKTSRRSYEQIEDLIVELDDLGDLSPIACRLNLKEFRELILSKLLTLIRETRIKEMNVTKKDFVVREPTDLIQHLTVSDYQKKITKQLQELIELFPELEQFAQKIFQLLEKIIDPKLDGEELVSLYRECLNLENSVQKYSEKETEKFIIRAQRSRVNFYVKDKSLLNSPFREALRRDLEDLEFLAQVSSLAESLRDEEREPTANEKMVIEAAYTILKQGHFIPSAYQDLGISGFREFQTSPFITDPGEGHISVTCGDLELMRGAVVHIEHIDRDKEADRTLVEPYRLPAAINAAKVRLHVGCHAPCTAFIGRPVFEGNFKHGLLKAVHTTASACNTMFRNGISDCKIAIDNMTASESIAFMKGVAGNSMREPGRQLLAAAFNVNTPIIDDRNPNTEPKKVVDRLEIGMVAIELALLGGFDKVTWDGASDEIPSRPILGQLSFSELLTLVHKAHEVGLNCYISAGLEACHLREAVYLGIDGVGIGTSLHFFTPEVGMGALKPETIRDVLSVRNQAMKETLGQAAILLARLDRLYFEGVLIERLDESRHRLFEALKNQNEDQAEQLLMEFDDLSNLSYEREQPALAQARRLVQSEHGQKTILASQTSSEFYNELIEELKYLMSINETQAVTELINQVNQNRHNS